MEPTLVAVAACVHTLAHTWQYANNTQHVHSQRDSCCRSPHHASTHGHTYVRTQALMNSHTHTPQVTTETAQMPTHMYVLGSHMASLKICADT